MPKLDAAVDTLIQQGLSDDEIKTVVSGIRQQTDAFINEGRSDEEIESLVGQMKWKGISLFEPEPIRPFAMQPGRYATPPTSAADLTPEQKKQFMQVSEGEGIEARPITNNPIVALSGGLAAKAPSVLARMGQMAGVGGTLGAVQPFITHPTDPIKALKEVPASAATTAAEYAIFEPVARAAKLAGGAVKSRFTTQTSAKMAEEAAKLQAAGARIVPGTTQTAPNITGYVENIGRNIVTPGKGTVRAYTDDLAAQLEVDDYIRQSPGGKLALEADLREGRGTIVDPEVTFNINNASLRQLEGQLETITRQHDDLFKSIGHMKEGSRAPARNILARMASEKQSIADEITNLRAQQNELMPQMADNLSTQKARELADQEAIEMQLREAQQTNIYAKEVLQSTREPQVKEGFIRYYRADTEGATKSHGINWVRDKNYIEQGGYGKSNLYVDVPKSFADPDNYGTIPTRLQIPINSKLAKTARPIIKTKLPTTDVPTRTERATPEQLAAQKAIDDEVVRRGREYLSDTITPADLDLKDIPGGWYSGMPEGKPLNWYVQSDKLDKLRGKLVLDVGSTIRLTDNEVGTIAGLRQDGTVRVVTKSGANKGKEVFLTPQQTYGSILRNVTAEPDIVGKTLKTGKINFTGNSGLTHRQAFDKLDSPSISNNEVQIGGSIINDVVRSKSTGLSSLNTPPHIGIGAQNRPIKGVSGPGKPTGPNTGKVSQIAPQGVKHAIQTFAFKFRPTWRVASQFEQLTGIPTFTKLYRYGREASDNYMRMKLDYGEQIDKHFKDAGIYHFSKKNKEAQTRVTKYLEKIDSADVNIPAATLATKLQGNIKEVKVAVELRKLYDEAAANGSIDPKIYAQYYSPRRAMPDEPIFDFVNKRSPDWKAFFQHQRTGNLMPREDNSLILAHKYFDTWSRSKYLAPYWKDIAAPMLHNKKANIIQNATAREFFINYADDVMRYPRQSMVEANDRMYTLVNNTIGKLTGNQKLADDLLAKFGQERMSEVLSDKMLSMQYKTFLGYRPIPALRNATQKIFALPFMSTGHRPFSAEGELIRGWALAKTKEGREKVLASGISGNYQELTGVAAQVGKHITSPMHAYQKVEISNRASIYLPIHDRVNKAFKDGQKLSEIAKNVNLHLYPEVIQEEFKRLYNIGAVRDVRQGASENAAHFLGDWAQLMTQFPYEKGGGPEIFRQSAKMKQFGAFQSWSLFTADYLTNMAKDIIQHPVEQRQKLYALGKMYAYYTMLDSAMEYALGIDFHSNPQASVPTTALTGSPSAQAIEGLSKIVGSAAREAMLSEVQKRSGQYNYLDREYAEGVRTLANLPVPGIVKDINKWTGEKNILSSTKKIIGID